MYSNPMIVGEPEYHLPSGPSGDLKIVGKKLLLMYKDIGSDTIKEMTLGESLEDIKQIKNWLIGVINEIDPPKPIPRSLIPEHPMEFGGLKKSSVV